MRNKLRVVSVVGARPQFIKAAPLELEIAKWDNIEHFSVHTGQHYDDNMSKVFFDELGLSDPYCNLHCGGGTHATQTAAIMIVLEKVLLELLPDIVVVFGDTNSTMAAAIVAAKMHIPVAHIEAGLRSFNKEMPEEINRIIADHVSDILFTPTESASEQLESEGLSNIVISGDIMLDMLEIIRKDLTAKSELPEKYYYATIHRPYNTDDENRLLAILNQLNLLGAPVYFSLHPRTGTLLKEKYNVEIGNFSNIHFIPPQGYFDNINYLMNCSCLITDSGGMQKEAYFLSKKCITIRSETEWTETLENDCNILVWDNISDIPELAGKAPGAFRHGIYGDGKAAAIIVTELMRFANQIGQ